MTKSEVMPQRELVIRKRYTFIVPKVSLWEDRSSQPNRLDDLYKSFGSTFFFLIYMQTKTEYSQYVKTVSCLLISRTLTETVILRQQQQGRSASPNIEISSLKSN